MSLFLQISNLIEYGINPILIELFFCSVLMFFIVKLGRSIWK